MAKQVQEKQLQLGACNLIHSARFGTQNIDDAHGCPAVLPATSTSDMSESCVLTGIAYVLRIPTKLGIRSSDLDPPVAAMDVRSSHARVGQHAVQGSPSASRNRLVDGMGSIDGC